MRSSRPFTKRRIALTATTTEGFRLLLMPAKRFVENRRALPEQLLRGSWNTPSGTVRLSSRKINSSQHAVRRAPILRARTREEKLPRKCASSIYTKRTTLLTENYCCEKYSHSSAYQRRCLQIFAGSTTTCRLACVHMTASTQNGLM